MISLKILQRDGHSSRVTEREKEDKLKCSSTCHKLNVPVSKDKEESDEAAKLEELEEKCRHQRTPYTK